MARIRTFGLGVLLLLAACRLDPGTLLPPRDSEADPSPAALVARLVHVTDTHVMDEESPARFPGAGVITRSAWRPYESYSTQLLDGILRTVNRIHADGRPIDFLVHTGDATDNAQSNELAWFLTLMEGGRLDPGTGPDDRPADERPPPERDPHAPFEAQGLYRQGVHGALPSIPWYIVPGNHDEYALGTFPIFALPDGRRVAPLPADERPGLLLPVWLDPLAGFTHGRVTPADPGPQPLLSLPEPVARDPSRAYFDDAAFLAALSETLTGPPGHGLLSADPGTDWYSTSPRPGLRLIGLNTTDRIVVFPGQICVEGALSRSQFAFLQRELVRARRAGELVIVATHHPSQTLGPLSSSQVSGEELRALLNAYPEVVLHLAGHMHRHRVIDRGGYLEIETASTLDPPQEGRLIELWRDAAGGITIRYETFSHLDDALPPLGDDPLHDLRAQALALAAGDKLAAARQLRFDPSGAEPAGRPADRRGTWSRPAPGSPR